MPDVKNPSPLIGNARVNRGNMNLSAAKGRTDRQLVGEPEGIVKHVRDPSD